jgi:hypothetical protein
MDPDDAYDRDDDDRPSVPPERRITIDIDSIGGWTFLILLLLLAYRCNGVTLW